MTLEETRKEKDIGHVVRETKPTMVEMAQEANRFLDTELHGQRLQTAAQRAFSDDQED
jgi:hypothetical protein